MKRSFFNAATAVGCLLMSGLALGQTGEGALSSSGLIAIGASLAVGLATLGAASAQGGTARSALEGIARNPTAKDQVFQPFIIGLVFMEFQALLGFIIAILWTFKV